MSKQFGGAARAWLGADKELTFVVLRPQRWQFLAARLSEVLPRCAKQVAALAAGPA